MNKTKNVFRLNAEHIFGGAIAYKDNAKMGVKTEVKTYPQYLKNFIATLCTLLASH